MKKEFTGIFELRKSYKIFVILFVLCQFPFPLSRESIHYGIAKYTINVFVIISRAFIIIIIIIIIPTESVVNPWFLSSFPKYYLLFTKASFNAIVMQLQCCLGKKLYRPKSHLKSQERNVSNNKVLCFSTSLESYPSARGGVTQPYFSCVFTKLLKDSSAERLLNSLLVFGFLATRPWKIILEIFVSIILIPN